MKHYPTDDQLASCLIVAAAQAGLPAGKVSNAILRAIWAEDRNISDRGTLRDIANGLGMDGDMLLDVASKPESTQRWASNTKRQSN